MSVGEMPAIKPIQAGAKDLPDHHVSRMWVTHSTSSIQDDTNWTDILSMNVSVDESGHLLTLACLNVSRSSSSLDPIARVRIRVNANTSPNFVVGAWQPVGRLHNHFLSHLWELSPGTYTVALQMQRVANWARITAGHRALVAILLKR